MARAKPSAGYVLLAYLLTETPLNVVITTNFDRLIEKAVNDYTQALPLVVGHEELASHASPEKRGNRPTIIKIHRDLLLGPQSSVSSLKEPHENWKVLLDKIFREYSPVFIGYGGNDPDLMDFLISNGEQFKDGGGWCCPYWLLYKQREPEGKIAEFLDKSDGYAIEHDGFDETMLLLGDALGYEMPKKEDFLAEYEKRFDALRRVMEDFWSKRDSQKSIESQDEAPAADRDRPAGSHDRPDATDQAVQQIFSKQSPAFRHFIESASLHNAGKYDEALAAAQKAVDLEPDNARYQNGLSVTLHKMERYDEALAAVQKAVELEPDNAEYQDSLGVTLHKMECYDEALAAKQKAVDLEPDNARYQNNLGITLYKMGKAHYTKALEALKTATLLEPDNDKYAEAYSHAVANPPTK